METRKIGSLEVSVVGLGCNNFGRRIDQEATKLVVDAALDAGINFLDTADIYGGTKSEEFLGNVLGSKRDSIVLATKFGMPHEDGRNGAKPAYVKLALEDSLRRLQTDRIDLYQLHKPDNETPIADTLGAMNDLVKAGKVREIGCSNFSPLQLQEAEKAAEGGARFVSVQNEYSLLNREPEKGVLKECRELHIAFIPYFPLASGLLSGKYRKGQPIPEGTRIQEGSERLTAGNLETVEALIGFAESRSRTILELAFSWLLAHGEVASVIAGATKPEQAISNAAAAAWKLTGDEMKEVAQILSNQYASTT